MLRKNRVFGSERMYCLPTYLRAMGGTAHDRKDDLIRKIPKGKANGKTVILEKLPDIHFSARFYSVIAKCQ